MVTIDYKSVEVAQKEGQNYAPLSTRVYRGRIRIFSGYFRNTTGAAIPFGKNIALVDVPAGKVLPTSRIYWSAFGSTATMSIGYDDYFTNKNAPVAANQTFFRSALDVSAASSVDLGTWNRLGYEFEGNWQMIIRPQVIDMPVNAEVAVYLHVVID